METLFPVTCVRIDGPFSAGIDPGSGDEHPEWCVFPADDDGYEVGEIEYFKSYHKAWDYAEGLAVELGGVEIVNDGGPA